MVKERGHYHQGQIEIIIFWPRHPNSPSIGGFMAVLLSISDIIMLDSRSGTGRGGWMSGRHNHRSHIDRLAFQNQRTPRAENNLSRNIAQTASLRFLEYSLGYHLN